MLLVITVAMFCACCNVPTGAHPTKYGVSDDNGRQNTCCVDAGLILADSANMVLRIGYSWRFIKTRASGLQLRDWAPSLRSCAVCALAAGALRECKIV